MSAKSRWAKVFLAVVLAIVLGGAGAYYVHARSSGTEPSAMTAAAKSIAVPCDEASLPSCLEKTPPQTTTELGTWPDATSPTVQQFAAQYSPRAVQSEVADLQRDGIQAIAHKSLESLPADGPGGDVVVLRFASAQGARASALGLNGVALSGLLPAGDEVQMQGLPGDVYTGLKAADLGYTAAHYATSVGNLTMLISFESYNTFDATDFATWAGGEYLSLSSARIPPTPTPTVQTAATSCVLAATCLMSAPSGDVPWTNSWSLSNTVTLGDFVTQEYPSAQQQHATQMLKAQELTAIAHTTWSVNQGNQFGVIQADDILLQFATTQGAQSRNDEETSGLDKSREFSVPGPGSAQGDSSTSPDPDGDYHTTVYGYVGDIAVEMHVYDELGPDQADAVDWATQQLKILAAATSTSNRPAPALAVTTTTPSEAGVSATCSDAAGCVMPLPAGATAWTGAAYFTSDSLSTEQFVAGFYQGDSSSQLTVEQNILGFDGVESIAHHDWTAQDGDEADVFILEFGSATGAQADTMNFQGAVLGAGREFSVPGSSTAIGVVAPSLDDRGNSYTQIVGYYGRYEVRMQYYSPAFFSSADAISWYSRQTALLPTN